MDGGRILFSFEGKTMKPTMTKREQVAAMAMQGLLADPNIPTAAVPSLAVAAADGLLAELQKQTDREKSIYEKVLSAMHTTSTVFAGAKHAARDIVDMLRREGLLKDD